MNREETAEAIKVMEHYRDGGEVEYQDLTDSEWYDRNPPIWDWIKYAYRIKKSSGECWADITERGTIIGIGGSVPESVSTNCDYDGAVLRTKIKWEEID